MSHPFKVGGKYYNRNGQYEVIEIGSTEMVIRYANGETQRVNINLQQQIWENWQIEQELENEKRQSTNAPKSKTAARPKALDEQKIYRFMENDFKPSVAGTVWRAKNNLAGQLAQRLSLLTGRNFESVAVPRRPQIQVVEPYAFVREKAPQESKFTIWLEVSRACYGFYVEKNSGKIDQDCDWHAFVKAISHNVELQINVLRAMQELTLRWEIYFDSNAQPAMIIIPGSNYPLLRMYDETREADGQEISWEEFAHEMQSIPESRQCEVCLVHSMPKERALELGTRIIDSIVPVWKSLLPLYVASTSRR